MAKDITIRLQDIAQPYVIDAFKQLEDLSKRYLNSFSVWDYSYFQLPRGRSLDYIELDGHQRNVYVLDIKMQLASNIDTKSIEVPLAHLHAYNHCGRVNI